MPSRAGIDPVNIRGDLLPLLFLLDVVRGDEGLDYLYRLVGTAMRTWSDVIRRENHERSHGNRGPSVSHGYL